MKSFYFFLLVFALSIPFWILNVLAPDITTISFIKLPLSALMTFNPLLAAMIIGRDKARLVSKAFDYAKIKNKNWYYLILFLMPLIVFFTYWQMKLTGKILVEMPTPLFSILIYFVIFFIGAIGEELGWSGYVLEPLQNKIGALSASIIIGFVWASWHIIPWAQMHHNSEWIFWQFTNTILLRIIMVWIFNNTGKSVFGMVLFHTMINISWLSFPNYGAQYNPFIETVFLFVVVLIALMWDTKTLSRFYFSKNKQEI